MQNNTKTGRKPNIRISQSDHARLSVLASTVAARNPEAADELLAELERARIVADRWVSAGTGLPMVEISGLTIVPSARILYAATHGRSAWSMELP